MIPIALLLIYRWLCVAANSHTPEPILLYNFAGDTEAEQLSETITGDARYKLQFNGASNRHISNGILYVDGTEDFLYTEQNIHIPIKSHSLEVLTKLDGITAAGGGAIAIDSFYGDDTSTAAYTHNKFDAIVYNEKNDKQWMPGSDFFRRTQTVNGPAETQAIDFVHVVITYDVDDQIDKSTVTVYRNGVQYGNSYITTGYLSVYPNGIFDDSGGYRVMIGQRHLGAGASDYKGWIDYGAVYDYALSPQEVAQLYQYGPSECASDSDCAASETCCAGTKRYCHDGNQTPAKSVLSASLDLEKVSNKNKPQEPWANMYGYILLIGLIAFILINNVFIGYWCVTRKTKSAKYAKSVEC